MRISVGRNVQICSDCSCLLINHQNTADSWKNTQATVDEIKAAFGPLSRRSLLFAASLALKQVCSVVRCAVCYCDI